jgi:hypothetical protein
MLLVTHPLAPLCPARRYDQAADALRREIGLHQDSEHLQAVGRLAVALVLVQLARGDYVAGEKAFKEWGNYCDAPEVRLKTGLGERKFCFRG